MTTHDSPTTHTIYSAHTHACPPGWIGGGQVKVVNICLTHRSECDTGK